MINCFTCNSDQYFNVETKKCDYCNGVYDVNSNLCSPRVIPAPRPTPIIPTPTPTPVIPTPKPTPVRPKPEIPGTN